MTYNKLTVDEVKQALKHCANMPCLCSDCILFEPNDDECQCSRDLKLNALDLINRYEAENKRLSTLAELGNTRANDYRVMRDRALKAEAEIERLRKKCENTQIGYNFAQDDIKTLKKEKYKLQKALNQSEDYRVIAKAEAYKECIEKVKKELFYWVGTDNCIPYLRVKQVIDNTLDELVGDNK